MDTLTAYIPLVRRIAGSVKAHLPAHVEVDDLVQEGVIGLMDAASRYEQQEGATFETFASRRIRGAIVDALREWDWASRQTRERLQEESRAIHKLGFELGREPTNAEVEAVTGHPRVEAGGPVDDEDIEEPTSDTDLLAELLNDELGRVLDAALRSLQVRQREVVELVYGGGMTLEEVATVMGVDKSYVCRLRAAGVESLAIKTAWYVR